MVRRAVLAVGGLVDLAAQLVREELQAVADAEHRDAQLEDEPVGARAALGEHRRGAAGEDDAPAARTPGCASGVMVQGWISQ